MKDIVELALELIEKDRRIDQLQSKLASSHTQVVQLRAQLQSAQRETDRLAKIIAAEPGTDSTMKLLAEQEQQIEQLREHNERLREELEKARRAGKRQASPFRRGKHKANPKHPGRRKGKGKFDHRHLPNDEQVTRCETVGLSCCPQCTGKNLSDRQAHSNYQIELPEVSPEIIRFDSESAFCHDCNERVQSSHHEQLSQATGAAAVCLGPRLIATAADLHVRLGVPYAKVAEFLNLQLRLGEHGLQPISTAALCQNVLRLGSQAEGWYSDLIDELRRAAAVHVDETGWRIGTLNAWLWVFTNVDTTVYLIRSGEGARGHKAIVEILGEQFAGTLISDCFAAYDKDKLDGWLKQKCFSHLLKDLSEMKEAASAIVAAFLKETTDCLKAAMALKETKNELSATAYSQQCAKLEVRLDAILDNYANIKAEDAARFIARLRKQRRHLFGFLYDDAVEPTNNRAERQLRPAVVVRKTQGCNKSRAGADAHAHLCSVAASAKQRRASPVDCLRRVALQRAGPSPEDSGSPLPAA